MENYGTDLAAQVAAVLRCGRRLKFHHRDYCGKGLMFKRGRYYYADVRDGELGPERGADWAPGPDEMIFDSDDEFIAWLAVQSDLTLHNGGSQGINRRRLALFLARQGEDVPP